MSLLAKRYAVALHLAAKAANAVATVESDLQALHAGMQDRVVRALLLSPEIKTADRERTALKLVAGKSQLVQNLMRVVVRRRRQEVLPDLYPAFHALCMQERGEIEGVVESPRPVGAEELAQLQQIARKLSGKTCVLSVRVRPELIGGVRLFVGNVLYDGSVKSNLEQLEQKLLQASV